MRTSELPSVPDRLLLPGENFADNYDYKIPGAVQTWLGESADSHYLLAKQYAADSRLLAPSDPLRDRLARLADAHNRLSGKCLRLLFEVAETNIADRMKPPLQEEKQ